MNRFHPASLTARLVFLFGLVAIVTFAGVGTYLYHSLSRQLETRDDDELLGKIRAMSHLVQEAGSVDAIRRDPHIFMDAAAGHDQLVVLMKVGNDDLVVNSHPETEVLSFSVPATNENDLNRSAVSALKLRNGGSARAVATAAIVGKTNERVEIMVARTASDRMQLLDGYHAEVWTAALGGTLLATVLSYFLVLRGLRPLRMVARQAQTITAHRLDTRLDMTAAPQELHEIVQSFNAMLDRLHASFERLTQFSADLAHDLRTPLNNLMVQTQVAISQVRTPEEYQALLISNIEEYERLTRMTESMLFLARAEHAHVVVNKESLDIETELRRIAEYFEGIAEDAGITIQASGKGTLFADAILLRRAVSNLVANAIRYTPIGHVVKLEARKDHGSAIVSVSNPGRGIEADHLERIFDRFYRADTARSNSAFSTGLGLAIVQSIMTLHGGTATAESAIDGATVFKLTFPPEAPLL
ncbi:heavy metal sensor histidine kinase [Herbaspirillum sp. RV1423]|uniref:heavy metal sensor histidine kinase n=1 Tax=Herbaspirillum sp. RV1423 TaxID=1443993 RepID=UPI0004B5DA17|nr:heavy metal sensor histidine kinase [Herbaspirillum sp. RV1423]